MEGRIEQNPEKYAESISESTRQGYPKITQIIDACFQYNSEQRPESTKIVAQLEANCPEQQYQGNKEELPLEATTEDSQEILRATFS